MPADITYVIGYRDGRYLSERRPHLYATINNLLRQSGAKIEIIIVEESRKPLLNAFGSPVRHFHLNSDLPYCRSQIANTGLYSASSPYMVMHDADVLVPPDYTERLLGHFRDGAKVLHIGKYARQLYSWETDELFLSNGDKYEYALKMVSKRGPHKKAFDQPSTGYSIAFDAETARSLGGFSMKFIGWGYEDASFIDKAKRKGIYSNPREATIIHMEHPRSEVTAEGQKCAITNKQLFEQQIATDIDMVIEDHRKELESWKDTKTFTEVKGVSSQV